MNNTKKLTILGVLGALSVILVTLIHFPIFPAASFLEYDPADIPIFVAAFLIGPLSGFVLTVVVSVIQGVTVSSASGYIGILMHIFSTGAFVLAAGNIYRINRTKKGAMAGLAVGVAVMTAVMTLWNLLLTPIFMGVPRQAVAELLLPAILPFNIIKSGVNAIVTMFVYKKISTFVNKHISK